MIIFLQIFHVTAHLHVLGSLNYTQNTSLKITMAVQYTAQIASNMSKEIAVRLQAPQLREAIQNIRNGCQMTQLVAEEMGFGKGWNSPSYTTSNK